MTDRVSWLPDGGDMGALIRAKDWSATPLGALESWPPELKAVTGLLLSQDFAMILLGDRSSSRSTMTATAP
jgi:hypothetical protein